MPNIFTEIADNREIAIQDRFNSSNDLHSLLSQKDPRYQRTPVTYAAGCATPNWNLVKYMAGKKESIIEKSGDRYEYGCALFFAVSNNNEEIAKFLLDHGAYPSYEFAGRFKSALDLAIHNNNARIVGLLMKHGDSVNVSQLEKACKNKYWDIVKSVAHYCKFSLSNKKSFENYLFSAIADNKTGIVNFLIAKGVKPDCKNEKGQTALDYAIEMQCYDAIKTLTNTIGKKQISNAESIFNLLRTNAISADKIPGYVKEMRSGAKALLAEGREKLMQSESKDFSTEDQEKIAWIINSMLNYPKYLPSDADMEVLQKNKGKCALIFKYLEIHSSIDRYCHEMRQFLLQQKKWFDHSAKQLEKSWWIFTWEGTPAHVEFFKQQLAHVNEATKNEEVLQIYENIIASLWQLKPAKNRRPNTTMMYENLKEQISQNAFIPFSATAQTVKQTSTGKMLSNMSTVNELADPPAAYNSTRNIYPQLISPQSQTCNPQTSNTSGQSASREKQMTDKEFNNVFDNLPNVKNLEKTGVFKNKSGVASNQASPAQKKIAM